MLIGILSAAIGLGLMVLLHEWGHFVVARLFGVRVDVFSIGFGPRLWGFRHGPTDYRVSALPLGGYVRMAGDNPSEERTGAPDEFLSKPRWQRVLIALAGPTTNLLLAIVLMAGIFVRGGQQPLYADKPVVIAGVVKDSPAQTAGLQPGDRIVSFAGLQESRLGSRRARTRSFRARAHGAHHHRARRPIDRNESGSAAAAFCLHGISSRANPGGICHPWSACRGRWPDGRRHDRRGQWPAHQQPVALVGDHSGEQRQSRWTWTFVRGGQNQKIMLRPTFGDPGDGNPRWQIGIAFQFASAVRSYSVPEAIAKAGETQPDPRRQDALHRRRSVYRQSFAQASAGPAGHRARVQPGRTSKASATWSA